MPNPDGSPTAAEILASISGGGSSAQPRISFGPRLTDPSGREYQVDSQGQIHYLPAAGTWSNVQTDPWGRQYQLDSDGAIHYLPAPPAPEPYPGGPGDTGINPGTGLPWYVVPDKTSPSGYTYTNTGEPVYANGAPFTGGGEAAAPPTTRTDSAGNTYQWNGATGKWELLWGAAPKITSSGGGGGGGGGAGGGGGGAAIDPTRITEYQQGMLSLQRDQMAQQNRQFLAELGIDTSRLGLDAATALAKVISSTDPLAAEAFWLGGGRNLHNAIAGGGSALSDAALSPAAWILSQMQGGAGGVPGGVPGTAPGGGAPPPGAATPPGGTVVNGEIVPPPRTRTPAWLQEPGMTQEEQMAQQRAVAVAQSPAPEQPGMMTPLGWAENPVVPTFPLGPSAQYPVASPTVGTAATAPPLPPTVLPYVTRAAEGGPVNDPMMMVGDARGPNPRAGGARPELVVNPTRAPLDIIPSEAASHMVVNPDTGQPMPPGMMIQPGQRAAIRRYADGTTAELQRLGIDPSYYLSTVAPEPAPAFYTRPRRTPTAAPTSAAPAPAASPAPVPPPAFQGGPVWQPPATAGSSPTGVNPGPLPPAGALAQIRNLRQGVPVPDFYSYMDVRNRLIPPTERGRIFASLQSKYGVPAEDWQAEEERYRLPGQGRGAGTMGY